MQYSSIEIFTIAIILLYIPLLIFGIYKIIISNINNSLKVLLTVFSFALPVIGLLVSALILFIGTQRLQNQKSKPI